MRMVRVMLQSNIGVQEEYEMFSKAAICGHEYDSLRV